VVGGQKAVIHKRLRAAPGIADESRVRLYYLLLAVENQVPVPEWQTSGSYRRCRAMDTGCDDNYMFNNYMFSNASSRDSSNIARHDSGSECIDCFPIIHHPCILFSFARLSTV
jgi:hypothetical protein